MMAKKIKQVAILFIGLTNMTIYQTCLIALQTTFSYQARVIPKDVAKKRLEKLLRALPRVSDKDSSSDREHRKTIIKLYTNFI